MFLQINDDAFVHFSHRGLHRTKKSPFWPITITHEKYGGLVYAPNERYETGLHIPYTWLLHFHASMFQIGKKAKVQNCVIFSDFFMK